MQCLAPPSADSRSSTSSTSRFAGFVQRSGSLTPHLHSFLPTQTYMVWQVVDASSSISLNLGGSGNNEQTFQTVVKGFLKTFTASVQTIASE
jgi:hypothetical protein